MKIRVNKSGIKRTGDKLVSNAEKLHTEGQKINAIINELAASWEGKDRDKCIAVVKDTYLVNLGRLKSKINAYGKYLQQVPKAYDEVDNTYMKKKIK